MKGRQEQQLSGLVDRNHALPGWGFVEPGYYAHDEYGAVIRHGGTRYGPKSSDAVGWIRGGKWMLYPPAAGINVDIGEPYAGPYKSAKAAMRAAEAFFPGSKWEQELARGKGYRDWEQAPLPEQVEEDWP